MSDNLPPLPETVYGLFYEAQASDDDEGYQELFDEPAFTADQMKTYARAAIEADRVSRDVPASNSVAIDYRQALELVEMFGGEPAEVRLIHGDGHSGPGLYAYHDELPEEGANFLGETDHDATPQPQPVCPTCSGHGMIGGPSFYAPDEGGVPCPDCNQPQPVQAQPSDETLDCDVAPRALQYQLKDYHRCITDGPLHYTWQDKPHRIVYDLIAAVRFYAQPKPANQQKE